MLRIMTRSALFVLVAFAALQTGCGDSTTSPGNPQPSKDASTDSRVDASTDALATDTAPDSAELDSTPQDVLTDSVKPDTAIEAASDSPSESAVEASSDVTPESSLDVMVDVLAEGSVDATQDTSIPSSRPKGQCDSDNDCGGEMSCNMSAPGGLCTGCGQASDCPDPLFAECYVGTCQRICNVDDDCPLGLKCFTPGHRCQFTRCEDGCTAPYVCEDSFCRRPKCATQDPKCPAGMVCGNKNYCVETP